MAEFRECAGRMRNLVENLTLATDFICGFPGESELDQQESLTLIEDFKFPVVNISQFYPRPGTVAAKMTRVKTEIVKKRSQEMTHLFMSYTTLDRWIGKQAMVWFSCQSDRSTHIAGHTKQYIKVLVEFDRTLIGTQRVCKFTAAKKWHLMGEIF